MEPRWDQSGNCLSIWMLGQVAASTANAIVGRSVQVTGSWVDRRHLMERGKHPISFCPGLRIGRFDISMI